MMDSHLTFICMVNCFSSNPDVCLLFANGGKIDLNGSWDSVGLKAYCYFNQVRDDFFFFHSFVSDSF